MPNFAVDVRDSLKDRPRRVYMSGASPRAVMDDALRQGLIVETIHPYDPTEISNVEPVKPTPPPPPPPPAPIKQAPTTVVKIDATPTIMGILRVLAWIFIIFVGVPLVAAVVLHALSRD